MKHDEENQRNIGIPRHNNFDILRLFLASMVVLYHCHDLSLSSSYFWIPYVTSSRLAVEGFFAISGCLIVASYDKSRHLGEYAKKRAKRILPAYWASFIFSLVAGSVMSNMPFMEFVKSPSTWKWIGANLAFATFAHPSLPGLFLNNPVMSSVNGALWTIKIELMFYLFVPLLVHWCLRFGRWQVLALMFVASAGYHMVCEHFNHPLLAKQLPGQLCYFMVGAAVYYYYHWFSEHRLWMWLAAGSSYLLSNVTGEVMLRALGVGLGMMCLGTLLPSWRGPTKYGDFSYGLYVFHFPIIQVTISIGLIRSYPALSLGLIYLVSLSLAIVSWNLVEKRWLQRERSDFRPIGREGLIEGAASGT